MKKAPKINDLSGLEGQSRIATNGESQYIGGAGGIRKRSIHAG
jgi:hypothetical protein